MRSGVMNKLTESVEIILKEDGKTIITYSVGTEEEGQEIISKWQNGTFQLLTEGSRTAGN